MAGSRLPLALAFFLALSGACGGDDDTGTPAEYETLPGPAVPQAPVPRRLDAEGEVTVTALSGAVATVTLANKVSGATVYSGKESGFNLEMQCGDTVADVVVSLYFEEGSEIIRVERRDGRWTVDGRTADVVPTRPASSDDAGAGNDGGDDAGDAGVADASASPPPSTEFVNGVGLPEIDHSRKVFVTLVSNDSRYDIRATIPWRESIAPLSCTQQKPGTGTSSSNSGGCGSGSSSSRRSSGGDWD